MNFITKRIRQIFFMNKLQKRVISALLTVCMVMGMLQLPGMTQEAKAASTAIGSTVTKILLNGTTELTSDTVVKNGDRLSIEFDWSLDNTDKTTTDFEVNLSDLNNKNINLETSGQQDLKDDTGNVVGYYQVVEEDGDTKLKIVINDKTFLNKDGRKGGVSIDGTVQINDTGLADGVPVEIALGTKEYTPTYYSGVAESSMGISKSTNGSLGKDGDQFVQEFKVSLNAYNGDVIIGEITDTYGNALGNPTSIKIDAGTTSGNVEKEKTFGSFEELSGYLKEKTLEKDKNIQIVYTQTVNHAMTGDENLTNTTSVAYKTNKGKETTGHASAKPSLTEPSVDKTGVLGADSKSVDWTITVKLGDYALGNKSILDVVNELVDIPGQGMQNEGNHVDIRGEMTNEPLGSDTYVCTYNVPISPAYLNSASNVSVKNDVKMTMLDGTEYTDSESVSLPPKNWVTKTSKSYDPDTKVITWEITINVPQGITQLAVSDDINEYAHNKGNHTLNWGLSVDGVEVITSGGKKTSDFDKYLSGYNEHWVGGESVFNEAYVASKYGKTITLNYYTTVTDESMIGKVYLNKVNVSYLDPALQTKQTQSAVGDYQNNSDLLTKTGSAVDGRNSIRYKVRIYLADYKGLTSGKEILIKEYFPDGMKYNPATADVKAGIENPWGGMQKETTFTYSEDSEKNGLFSVSLTDDVLNALSKDNPYLTLSYTLDVEDEAAFTMGGTKSFTNTAEATYDGNLLGKDSSTASLTPQKIVTKTGNYNVVTAPYAKYEIYINEETPLDLLEGSGTLTAVDKLGSALSYDISSIKVEQHNGSSWEELPKTDYKYTYNLADNAITFSELPDNKWLRITYRARVNLAYGESLTPENATNSFSLSGTASDAVKAEKGFSVVAVKPAGWATSETGQIEIFKFWTNDGQMVALDGSKFKVVRVKYDTATNTMVEDPGNLGDVDYNNGSAVVKTDIEVDKEGKVVVDGLSYARIYALYETQAKTGFALNTEPYYFVLAGSTATLPPASSGIKVSTFATGASLNYENVKTTGATLEVTKTLAGVALADADKVLQNLSFTVQKDGSTIAGGNFTGKDMIASGGVYKKTFSNLSAGTYTVKETVTDVTGYIYVSSESSYQVTIDGTDGAKTTLSGKEVTATGTVGATTTMRVDFTNKYKATAKLKITKAVTGEADWDDIKDTIKFDICESGSLTPIKTLTGTDFTLDGTVYSATVDGLDASKTYTVKESGTVLTGYTKITTYAATGTNGTSAADDVTTGDIALAANTTETVAFTNDYEVQKGTLKLTKTVAFDDATKTWDTVKDKLSFSVKSVSTGSVVATVTGASFTDAGSGVYEYVLPDALPIGSYIVTESVTDIFGMIVETKYVVTEDGTAKPETVGGIAGVIVANEKETSVAYTNNYKSKYATLVLRKSVTGDMDWDKIKDKISFKITDPNGVVTSVAGTSFTDAGSGVYVYKKDKLELEGNYTIEEMFSSEDADYTRTTTVKVDNNAATTTDSVTLYFNVPDGATVFFTNDYERNTGSLELNKTLTGVEASDVATALNTIQFEVTPSPTGTGANKTYKLSDFEKQADGTYKLAITKVPTGNYHVKEVVYDLSGYDTKSVEYTLTTAAGTESAVSNGKTNGADMAIVTEKTTSLAMEDTYEKYTGNLEIAKTVDGDLGWNDVKDKLSFRVTNAANGFDKVLTADDFTNNGSEYTVKLEKVPLGEYVVTETLQDVVGYTSTTTYAVGTSGTVAGKQGTVEVVSKGQTSHIAFTNTYKSLEKSILLKKSVTGALSWEQVRDTLSFELVKDGSVQRTIYGSQFTGPDIDGNYTYIIDGLTVNATYTIREVVTGENSVGYTRTTTVKVDDNGAVSGVQGTVDFDAGTGAVVAIVNDYARNTGKLELKKTLVDVVPSDIASAKNAIEFTVTPSPDGIGASKTYKLSDFVENADGTYSYIIENVPAATYKVKETAYDIAGYDTESVQYTVTANGTTTVPSDGKTHNANAVVTKDKTTTVSLTDDYKRHTGTIIITKTIKGDVTEEEAKGALQFKVTNTVIDVSTTYTLTDFKVDTNAATGEKKYTLELDEPIGTYEVEETIYDINGYVTASVKYAVDGATLTDGSLADVTVMKGATVNVEFEDSYIPTGNLVIKKTIKGEITKEEAEGALQFKVTNKDDGTSKTYTLKDFTKNADGTYTLNLKTNVGGYTVEETIYDVNGYVTASVKYSVDGGAQTEGAKTDVTVSKGQTTTVEFEDAYTPIVNKGKLVIKKTIKGDITKEEAEGALQFKVTNNTDGTSKTYTLKDFKKNTDGTYTLELDVNAGGYTVEETICDVNGYVTASVKYSVDGSAQTDGKKTDVSVAKDQTVTVAFEDAYEKEKTPEEPKSDKAKLVITKRLKGDMKRKAAESVIEFAVTNTKTKKTKTYTLKDFDYDEDTQKYTLELSVEPGTYKVQETAYDVEGYELKSITYAVGDGESEEGSEVKVKAKAGKTTKIAFVDTYKKPKTSSGEETPDTPTSSTTTTTTATTATTNRTTPKTGDEAPIGLWIAMLLAGVLGIGGGIYGIRKNKKQ